MRYILAILCCFASLYSDEGEEVLLPLSSPYQLANDDLIGGKVSPLSGQLALRVTDLVVKSAQPIYLNRIYVPPYMPCLDVNKEQERGFLYHYLSSNYRGWEVLPHLKIQVIPLEKRVRITDPNGLTLEYVLKDGKTTIEESHLAMSNTKGDTPHGSYDLRNTKIEILNEVVVVYSPDGTTRYYLAKSAREKIDPRILKQRPYTCYLQKEVLSNGKVLKYHYKNNNLSSIESLDPHEQYIYSSIQVEDAKFISSSGLRVDYKYDKVQTKIGKTTLTAPPILKSVSSPFYQNEEMGYCSSFLLNTYRGKEALFDSLYRPCNIPNASSHYRVHELKFPASPNGEMKGVYEIDYLPPIAGVKEGSTTERNHDGTKTIYYFHANLLPKVFSYFDQAGTLRKEKYYFWDENNWLKGIEIHDGVSHEILYKKSYQYDSFGNPIVETFYGDEPYSIFREYSQDGKNLLLREETEEGKITTYEYLPNTNLITKKQVLGICEIYVYDDCHNLIQELVMDGQRKKTVTNYLLRTTQPLLHMTEWIEEKYGDEEKLLKRTHLTYDKYGNVIGEGVYDSDGKLSYTLHREYNERGNLLSETNALGQKASYSYDNRGFRIASTNFSQRLNKTFSYDVNGRLVKEVAAGHISSYAYDDNDRLTEKTDYLNNKTRYTYDLITNKVIKTDSPQSVTTSGKYDSLGHKIEHTDANDNTTNTIYNAYGFPKKIIYPNGAEELFSYYKNGKVATHTNADGLTIAYEYDILGRVLEKKSDFFRETFTYDDFNLLSETDKEGNSTKYFYDDLDRKIREEKLGRITEFTYDFLGNLSTICKNNSLLINYKRDLLGNILEETQSDIEGTALYKISYTYDADGNQNTITRYINGNEAVDSYQYDSFGRLIEHRDALGYITTKVYDESGLLRIITTDPRSITTVETFDPFNRLIQKQVDEYSPKIFSYDSQGNLLIQMESDQTIAYTYNNTNQIESLTRSGKNLTTYTYTPSSNISSKTFPNGITLFYEYHPLGFLSSISSSDDRIHHLFYYDKLGRLVKATDKVQNLTIQRKLDPFGNVLEEIFPSGHKVQKTYDDFNRPLLINGVSYTYDPLYLRTVQWNDYSHIYNEYDLDGNLLKETTLTGDPIIHEVDNRGQKSSITHPKFTQNCTYDPVGNLIQRNDDSYDYDPLSQLISEGSNHYTYDSFYNRISKNNQKASFNDLNEIVSPYYSYDLNGNLTSKGNWHFSYDPLGRLVTAQNGKQKITFTYDPLGRRLSKTTPDYQETYLYDGQNEIGTPSKNFRILGLNSETVGIELKNKTYAPILDIQGSICRLIDASLSTKDISYSFTAFGEETHSTDFSNPWRFASKRLDPELGFVNFGKRYYDPISARWLTPDPAGFADSTNLYQFVMNNPFRYTDPHGEFIIAIPLILSYKIIAAALLTYAAAEAIRIGGDKLSNSLNYRLNLKGETLAKDVLGLAYTGYRTLYAQGVEEEVEIKGKKKRSEDVYVPDRPLPRTEDGVNIPDTDAPHTQLGTKQGRRGKYPQAREFDRDGQPIRDIDFTDHEKPDKHPNPHQHIHKPNETGGTPERSREAKHVQGWNY